MTPKNQGCRQLTILEQLPSLSNVAAKTSNTATKLFPQMSSPDSGRLSNVTSSEAQPKVIKSQFEGIERILGPGPSRHSLRTELLQQCMRGVENSKSGFATPLLRLARQGTAVLFRLPRNSEALLRLNNPYQANKLASLTLLRLNKLASLIKA